MIGETAGDKAASTFGVKAGVIFADSGLGFFPQFDTEKGGGFDQATFEGVFEIVATVSDFVGEIDGLGFERGLGFGARQGAEALADFVGEVEAVEFRVFDLELFDDAKALVAPTKATSVLHELVEGVFDGMAEGGMTEIPGEGDGLGEVFVEAEGAAEGAGEGGDLDGMGEASTDVVAGAVEWDLGFVFEATKSGAVNDAFAVSLKFGAEVMRFFGVFAAEAFAAFGGEGGEKKGFLFLPVFAGADRHLSGMDGSGGESRWGENSSTKDVNSEWMKGNKVRGESDASMGRRLNFSAMGEGVAEGDGIDEFEA